MKSTARKSILQLTPYLPGKPIEEVRRELGLEEVIKLASNESPFPPSPSALKAVTLAAPDQALIEAHRIWGKEGLFIKSAIELSIFNTPFGSISLLKAR